MKEKKIDIPEQAQSILDMSRSLFGEKLIAAYLHGSIVTGGLKPQSDIDLLLIIDCPLTDVKRKIFVDFLLQVSGHHPFCGLGARCIEVILLQKSELAMLYFPAQADFIYGEWLREEFEAGTIPMPVSDPEITLLLAQARQQSISLHGPAAIELLPEISSTQIRRAMYDILPVLLHSLDGDERNVLLTLARIWHTAATGTFVTKDMAATWVIPNLPEPMKSVLAAISFCRVRLPIPCSNRSVI